MLPLTQTSCSTLVEKLGESADTTKSVDVFRYTVKGMQPVQGLYTQYKLAVIMDADCYCLCI